ncbi:hypothetical protein [uncultured Brachyspira sp.]|nr:hypothetical protein [uncultured Brachyspira sp.]
MKKYNIKTENQIYDLIKKENLTFDDISKKLNTIFIPKKSSPH